MTLRYNLTLHPSSDGRIYEVPRLRAGTIITNGLQRIHPVRRKALLYADQDTVNDHLHPNVVVVDLW